MRRHERSCSRLIREQFGGIAEHDLLLALKALEGGDGVLKIGKDLLGDLRLDAALDQDGSERYIAMTCHTDNPDAEKSYLQFVEQIQPQLKPREFKLAQDGEILVRGENVSVGYWDGGHVHASGDSEWLKTGDLGELDAQGNLRFRGRKKNVIVTSAGLNIYPDDLEWKLRSFRQVRDCVVLGIRSGSDTEPCAVILPQTLDDNYPRAKAQID